MPQTKFTETECAAIERAIEGRKSVRAFLDTPVSEQTVARILEVASRAPSGTNMQPWRVHVVAGAAREKLANAVHDAFTSGGRSPTGSEYKYYPDEFFEPYLSRRRKVGFDMYGLLGIQRGDTAAMAKQLGQNYLFFGAPVGLMFTVDRRLEIGSWLDYGYFLEAVCVAARAHGLDTCSQQAFAYFHTVIREHLAFEDNEVLVCGMAMGYADWDATINKLETVRSPVSEFATFRGF